MSYLVEHPWDAYGLPPTPGQTYDFPVPSKPDEYELEEAREEARDEGIEEGRRDAMADARAWMETFIEGVSAAIEELEAHFE